jgi:hypothetical protein
VTLDEAGLFHLAQPSGQHIGGDAGESVTKVSEPTRTLVQQLPGHEQRPPITDDVERSRHCAVVTISTCAHEAIVAQKLLITTI